jgi:hypothetical protein
MLFIGAANALLLHQIVGRLAARVARAPGSPWLAFALASCVHAVFAVGPTSLLLFSRSLPSLPLMQYTLVAVFALLLSLALLVWRFVPWPVEAAERGDVDAT